MADFSAKTCQIVLKVNLQEDILTMVSSYFVILITKLISMNTEHKNGGVGYLVLILIK